MSYETAERPSSNISESGDAAKATTVLVRGETVNDRTPPPAAPGAQSNGNKDDVPKKVSQDKVLLQSRLPALADDADVGVERSQVVTRDGKADLAFTGTLLASAAPTSAPNSQWQELRVYETSGGKHVFSKVSRSIFAKNEDAHEAEVFDPTPSMPSQLLRSAKELTRSRPVEWTDAAADFFGYDPLAKSLYRKLSGRFEEHIG